MRRQALIDYLLDNGCVIVRTAKKGYSIVRNVINGEVSGIPVNEILIPTTVCRICKTLSVELPNDEGIQKAKNIVDIAHKNHNNRDI